MAVTIDAQNVLPVTRAQARLEGSPHFFTGKPCKRGHIAFRYTANKHCSECQKEFESKPDRKKQKNTRRMVRYEENKEHEAGLSAIWYQENKDRKRSKRLIWLEENSEHYRFTCDAWKLANPDKVSSAWRNRRARKRNADGSHTSEDIEFLFKVQCGKCAHAWCRKSLSAYKEVDHIIPLALGGSNDRRNLQLLCRHCNREKSDTHPIEFAQRYGMLL